MKQNRLKSPVLWGAVAAILLLVLSRMGFEPEIAEGAALADLIFNLVCALLAAFGIVNNPTDKNNF